jgi:hypothetical protein
MMLSLIEAFSRGKVCGAEFLLLLLAVVFLL